MKAFGLKRKRSNSVEEEGKLLVGEVWLLGPEHSTSDTTMEVRGLEPCGCTHQHHVALVSSKGRDALWGLKEEVSVLVGLGCLDQFVLGVVALELHNGTCSFQKINSHVTCRLATTLQ